jgi:hypothetical protein
MPKLISMRALGGLALLTTVGSTFAIETYTWPAQAQTPGMERRADRRDTRQQARTDKHACNTSGMASRSGCRQMKRGEKQEGRQDRMNGGPQNP